ncbi:MAG: hypothetical protein J0G35_05035, partial [Acidobacteriales bacterium]|nr:hypothetical protein [Terriglobales bacterium]
KARATAKAKATATATATATARARARARAKAKATSSDGDGEIQGLSAAAARTPPSVEMTCFSGGLSRVVPRAHPWRFEQNADSLRE